MSIHYFTIETNYTHKFGFTHIDESKDNPYIRADFTYDNFEQAHEALLKYIERKNIPKHLCYLRIF